MPSSYRLASFIALEGDLFLGEILVGDAGAFLLPPGWKLGVVVLPRSGVLKPPLLCNLSKFGFSAMTFAHVGYITKFLWGQRHPPGDSEVE